MLFTSLLLSLLVLSLSNKYRTVYKVILPVWDAPAINIIIISPANSCFPNCSTCWNSVESRCRQLHLEKVFMIVGVVVLLKTMFLEPTKQQRS